jgi:hypothetical protein
MSKITIIEGAKNVGKTFLLSQLENKTVYKFPFADYFNKFINTGDFNSSTESKTAYHFSTAYDVTLLSLNKLGLISSEVVVDRGFVSNIVLGLVQNRITPKESVDYIKYLRDNGWLEGIRIINIETVYSEAGRNKDEWEHLDRGQQDITSKLILESLKQYDTGVEIVNFINNFDEESVIKFKALFNV